MHTAVMTCDAVSLILVIFCPMVSLSKRCVLIAIKLLLFDPLHYRGQLEFVFSMEPVDIDQVEDAVNIVKRFATGQDSLLRSLDRLPPVGEYCTTKYSSV